MGSKVGPPTFISQNHLGAIRSSLAVGGCSGRPHTGPQLTHWCSIAATLRGHPYNMEKDGQLGSVPSQPSCDKNRQIWINLHKMQLCFANLFFFFKLGLLNANQQMRLFKCTQHTAHHCPPPLRLPSGGDFLLSAAAPGWAEGCWAHTQ